MDNLTQYNLGSNPFENFQQWFESAKKIEANAEAMSLATYDRDKNRPSTRYLLYKGMREQKIIFYTNYFSPKSHDLDANPEVALAFYWHESKKQVRIQGRVEKMTLEDSKLYFHSRDRESQIASYISTQSAAIASKEELLNKYAEVQKQFAGKEIPHPKNWGGYLVTPYEFEFFLYGQYRLNDRFLFELKNDSWIISRLQP